MKSKLCSLIFIAITIAANGQTQNINKVAKISSRGGGAIMHDNQVKGYFSFVQLEKIDAKTNNYQLSLVDENLRAINSIEIKRPTNYSLIDGAFNGQAFCFLFFNSTLKTIEFITYDRTLTQIGTFIRTIQNKNDLRLFRMLAAGTASLQQAYLIGIKDKGFLYYGRADKGLVYRTDFFDNNLKKIWTDESTNVKEVEAGSDGFQQGDYIGTLITKQKTATSKDMSIDLLVQEVLTGKKLFRIPIQTSQHSVTFSDVYYDSVAKTFTVLGEYYYKEAKELKDQSLGLIAITYDFTGKIVNQKTNSWAKEIGSVIPVNDKGKFDGTNSRIIFHDFIRTADGQFFAIGEQYKKATNGGAVAANLILAPLLGVYTSSTQLNIYNLVIFEFNPDFAIKSAHIFEKDMNHVMMPVGSSMTNPKQLSFMLKAVGGFDYKYTQESADNETFVVAYINFDKEKGQASTNVLGSVIYTPEKKFTVDKMPLKRSTSEYFVARAKEGYVLVTEYFRKEKRLESRLEKLNY